MDQKALQDSTQGQILAIVIAFPILALIAVILRLYTRLFVIKNAASEDLCIAVAVVLSIAVSICTCYEVHFGLGKRLAVANPANIGPYFKSLFASILIYNFGLLFTKLSILLQYVRICPVGPTRKVIYAVTALVIAYGIETFFSGTFTCTPVAYFWDPTIPGGKCVDKWSLYFANGGINIVTDFMILFLPALILKDLIMPKFQKFTLMAIIALGGAACIASIFRLHMLYKLSKSSDFLWDGPGTATWSSIELNVGIICASVSTLRPLVSRFLPKIFGSRPTYALQNKYATGSKSMPNSSARNFNPLHGDENENGATFYQGSEVELARQPSNGDIKVFTEYNVKVEQKKP
ncbi:hypothetical protein BGZ60DRAFT_516265 [Tricladium varicosporioides]|nr:hypothetical protein BGZ60DRAFT_516265 [Hymenoscyphus varicosporioides]